MVGEAADSHIASGNRSGTRAVEPGMGMDSVDRQALLDAGLDPDDPQVWAVQRRISDLLVCYGMTRATRRQRAATAGPDAGTGSSGSLNQGVRETTQR